MTYSHWAGPHSIWPTQTLETFKAKIFSHELPLSFQRLRFRRGVCPNLG